MVNCPCNSQKDYIFCCEPFISKELVPNTPEKLMRSRYTAYTMANIDYIKETMRDKALIGFDELDAKRWAKKVKWIKLQVFKTTIKNSNIGYVEFEATYLEGGRLKSIHEKSQFERKEGRWYYVSGMHLPSIDYETIVTQNMNCPCGSQRKYKNCHGKG